MNLVDGGIFANNPSLIGLSEALALGYAFEEISVLSDRTFAPQRSFRDPGMRFPKPFSGTVFALLVAMTAHAQPVVMRISHQVPPAHHLTKMLDGFAADVKARTNGQVEVQIYGSEQLAKAGENFPAVAKGNIEAAMSVNFQSPTRGS